MAARKPKAKRMSARIVKDEDYQLRHERVAGIDVAKASGTVCLRLPLQPGKARRYSKIWEVTAAVPEIADMAAELRAAGVEVVSMESTSDYWWIWFAVLEDAGLNVQLARPRCRASTPPAVPCAGPGAAVTEVISAR